MIIFNTKQKIDDHPLACVRFTFTADKRGNIIRRNENTGKTQILFRLVVSLNTGRKRLKKALKK